MKARLLDGEDGRQYGTPVLVLVQRAVRKRRLPYGKRRETILMATAKIDAGRSAM
jgi:hypothetical protein